MLGTNWPTTVPDRAARGYLTTMIHYRQSMLLRPGGRPAVRYDSLLPPGTVRHNQRPGYSACTFICTYLHIYSQLMLPGLIPANPSGAEGFLRAAQPCYTNGNRRSLSIQPRSHPNYARLSVSS